MAIMQTMALPGGATTEIPPLLLPEAATLFDVRAQRLRMLAVGHPMADFLNFTAAIAAAQQQAVAMVDMVDPASLAPDTLPLDIARIAPAPQWRTVLRALATGVAGQAPTPLARKLEALAATPDDMLEAWARGWLHGEDVSCDLAIQPLLAAALQVWWTVQASTLQVVLPRSAAHTVSCPVCGSHPVVSVVRAGASTHGLRYLVCALCSSQWHLPRIRCVNCGESARIAYDSIAGSDGAVQAESCDACHIYTKLLHQEKHPAMEALADDLATLSLDILVGEAGYRRYGFNPYLVPGTE